MRAVGRAGLLVVQRVKSGSNGSLRLTATLKLETEMGTLGTTSQRQTQPESDLFCRHSACERNATDHKARGAHMDDATEETRRNLSKFDNLISCSPAKPSHHTFLKKNGV